jgi:hypothetical protein
MTAHAPRDGLTGPDPCRLNARTDRRLQRHDQRQPAGRRHRGGVAATPRASGLTVKASGRNIVSVIPVRVMVVDDHPIWRDAVARDLVEAGYDVTAVVGEGVRRSAC